MVEEVGRAVAGEAGDAEHRAEVLGPEGGLVGVGGVQGGGVQQLGAVHG